MRDRLWAFPQCLQRSGDLAERAGLQVDIATLENTTEVGLVGVPAPEPLDRGGLVAKAFKEGVGEVRHIEGLFGETRDGFLNFYGIHLGQRTAIPLTPLFRAAGEFASPF